MGCIIVLNNNFFLGLMKSLRWKINNCLSFFEGGGGRFFPFPFYPSPSILETFLWTDGSLIVWVHGCCCLAGIGLCQLLQYHHLHMHLWSIHILLHLLRLYLWCVILPPLLAVVSESSGRGCPIFASYFFSLRSKTKLNKNRTVFFSLRYANFFFSLPFASLHLFASFLFTFYH